MIQNTILLVQGMEEYILGNIRIIYAFIVYSKQSQAVAKDCVQILCLRFLFDIKWSGLQKHFEWGNGFRVGKVVDLVSLGFPDN